MEKKVEENQMKVHLGGRGGGGNTILPDEDENDCILFLVATEDVYILVSNWNISQFQFAIFDGNFAISIIIIPLPCTPMSVVDTNLLYIIIYCVQHLLFHFVLHETNLLHETKPSFDL